MSYAPVKAAEPRPLRNRSRDRSSVAKANARTVENEKSDKFDYDNSTVSLQNDAAISDSMMMVTIFVDMTSYAVMLCRDYATHPYNFMISHYLGFVIISDLFCWFVPKQRRHWVNVFRLVEAIQFMWLTWDLVCVGAERWENTLTKARLLTQAVRFAHAAFMLYYFGPFISGFSNPTAILDYANAFLADKQHSKISRQRFMLYLALTAKCVVIPRVLYLTHWNYNEPQLDAPISASQATNAFTVWFKLLATELLVVDLSRRQTGLLLVSLLFVQFPFMWPMFANAPIPYVHVVADLVMMYFGVYGTWYERKKVETGGRLMKNDCKGNVES